MQIRQPVARAGIAQAVATATVASDSELAGSVAERTNEPDTTAYPSGRRRN